MTKNGFNWDYVRDCPIAKPMPYTANFKDACTVGDALAKAIKHMPNQTFRSTKPAKFYEVAE